ncbi:MAG TPA: nucleotidyltransferase domain-containing protein [Flavisolibacter sp.]|nr:nucleotidyltransferase domain-containing protein [Flavisolibacter sp.]
MKTDYCHEDFFDDLKNLAMESWIYKMDEFYSLREDYSLVQRRREGNMRAKNMLKTAEKIAGFLSTFPFVKGVAVSGSLSKNFADENSDIDFFIITERNKLWLARTFMHCFKKIAILFKKEDLFCMNYYIDEEMLQIKEKNIYTAIEIATLLPLRGIEIFKEFFKQNDWSKSYLPNHSLRVSYVEETRNPFFKKTVEFIFRNSFGNLVDLLLMNISVLLWKKKTRMGKLNKRGIVLSMDASKHYAKPNPMAFQKKFMTLYEKKIFNLFYRYESRAKTVF